MNDGVRAPRFECVAFACFSAGKFPRNPSKNLVFRLNNRIEGTSNHAWRLDNLGFVFTEPLQFANDPELP